MVRLQNRGTDRDRGGAVVRARPPRCGDENGGNGKHRDDQNDREPRSDRKALQDPPTSSPRDGRLALSTFDAERPRERSFGSNQPLCTTRIAPSARPKSVVLEFPLDSLVLPEYPTLLVDNIKEVAIGVRECHEVLPLGGRPLQSRAQTQKAGNLELRLG